MESRRNLPPLSNCDAGLPQGDFEPTYEFTVKDYEMFADCSAVLRPSLGAEVRSGDGCGRGPNHTEYRRPDERQGDFCVEEGAETFADAAAVFVITQEDIRRSGATNIPDLLRMVPGMDVAEINGSTWAISARGFNQQFSNKLLVMIDGRDRLHLQFRGRLLGHVWICLSRTSTRIEVIRGPGRNGLGSQRSERRHQHLYEEGRRNERRDGRSRGRKYRSGIWNGSIRRRGEQGTDYRVYAKYFNQTQHAGPRRTERRGWMAPFRGGFRMDSAFSSNDSLMVEGDIVTGREGELGFVLPSVTSPGFVAESEQINLGDGSLESVWNHVFSKRSDTTCRFPLIGTSGTIRRIQRRGTRWTSIFSTMSRWADGKTLFGDLVIATQRTSSSGV